MSEFNNAYQITRQDAKSCFVESLSDAFRIGKVHFTFAKYDVSRPAGQRQTDNVQIYISVEEFVGLCHKLYTGELRYVLQQKKNNNDKSPVYQSLGGTPSSKLKETGKSRPDGMSLSRKVSLSNSNDGGVLFTAESGAGEQNKQGLIVPRYGNNPENKVVVKMTVESFTSFILTTQYNYIAWLSSEYMKGRKNCQFGSETQSVDNNDYPKNANEYY